MPIQDNFAEQFIRGHALGVESKRRKEEFTAQQEERDWQRQMDKARIKHQEMQDKIAERIRAREEAIQHFKLVQGNTPGETPPGTVMPLPPPSQPGIPGETPPPPPLGVDPNSFNVGPKVTIPSTVEGGQPLELQADTMFQALHKHLAQQAEEAKIKNMWEPPTVVKPGESVLPRGSTTPTYTAPGKPPGEDEVKNQYDFWHRYPDEALKSAQLLGQIKAQYRKPPGGDRLVSNTKLVLAAENLKNKRLTDLQKNSQKVPMTREEFVGQAQQVQNDYEAALKLLGQNPTPSNVETWPGFAASLPSTPAAPPTPNANRVYTEAERTAARAELERRRSQSK